MKLWAGRTGGDVDERLSAINNSIGFDSRMAKQDITGSIAHARMLSRQGIVEPEDAAKIVEGLQGILADLESGALQIDMTCEDIHTFVEATLTERIGDAGKRLHTGRSRNDQVALDIRMYLADRIDRLIVSSIMSKKLAVGADVIVLDVKTGNGGFMKNDEDAEILARELIKVGRAAGKKVGAIVTDMDEPLGYAVGNALEVAEAIHVLQGKTEAAHLLELCLALGSLILTEGGLARDEDEARDMMLSAVQSGRALEKFASLVQTQGGNPAAVYNTELLPKAGCVLEVPAQQSGYVRHLAASDIGRICLHLGGGRETLDSVIDPTVGIVLQKKVGDRVEAGESLAQIHAKDRASGERAAEAYLQACTITAEKPVLPPFIRRRIV